MPIKAIHHNDDVNFWLSTLYCELIKCGLSKLPFGKYGGNSIDIVAQIVVNKKE